MYSYGETDPIVKLFNPLVPRVQKINIRKLALTDSIRLIVKEKDFDTHYCVL